MKLQLTRIALGIFIVSSLLTACDKDNDEEPNEEELITTMKLTFAPVSAGNTLTYQFKDPDGPGGVNATIDEVILVPATTYNVTVQLLNETVTPAEDITAEVAAEADAHRFYYEVQNGLNLTIINLNNDANGVPLGITSQWTTAAASTGKVNVTLRHYPGNPPNKAANDPEDSPKSSTDISTRDIGGFTVKIQ